jgi:hypothetical protein
MEITCLHTYKQYGLSWGTSKTSSSVKCYSVIAF